jgi:hypothetical protein
MDIAPAEWLKLLEPRLSMQIGAVAKYLAYYNGVQPIANITTPSYREEFAKLLVGICDNWMPLVVDSVEERMHVEGFRFGDEPKADDEAWKIWQRNFLDADSETLHSVMLTAGIAYTMVWAGDDVDNSPRITVEHPTQVYVAHAAGDRRKRLAAIKVWVDEWTGNDFAYIYTPDAITKFRRESSVSGSYAASSAAGTTNPYVPPTSATAGKSWVELPDEALPNPLGVVPIVPYVNRSDMFGRGKSDLFDLLSTQDQVNKLVADMIIAAEFAAFRQRWATGVEIPKDPATGQDLEVFKSAIQRLWHVPDENAKFGDFGETNIGNYVTGIEDRVLSIARRSRTPAHYMLGHKGQFPSGEALRASETGLVSKARSRMRHTEESHEETMRLAFLVAGDKRAEQFDAETIWRDPEYRTESEHVDSLLKKMSLGVPLAQLWEDAGYSPQQVARFKQMAVEEALNRALMGVDGTAPTSAPAPPSPPPVAA